MLYRRVLVVLGPAFFILSLLLPVDVKVAATIGTVLWMGAWWIGEVIPLAVTALIPLVIAPLFGIAPAKEIAPTYAKSPIFLFLGGFILAIALEKYDLHRYLSGRLLRVFGRSEVGVFVGVSLASYFLSMWISNTSATLIMVPLILSLGAGQLTRALAFGAAYSASIGGVATLIGTPPNIMYAGVMREYGVDVSFLEWMRFGLPYSMVLEGIFLTLGILWFRLGRRKTGVRFEDVGISRKGRNVLMIFLGAVLLWLTRSGIDVGVFSIPGWADLLPFKGADDSTVAMAATVLLFLGNFVDWKDTERVPWDALLLFGGGFALSHMIVKSGLSEVIVQSLKAYSGLPPVVFVGLWATITLALTELASNTSISAVFIPLAYSFAVAVGMDAKALAAVVAVAASGAFMLPVATPPNMLVYSFKLVSMRDMMRVGVIMNVIALILAVLLVYHLAP